MGETKQINTINRTYYFYNDQIDLKDFDAKLLKVDKKDYKEIDIYYIGYVTLGRVLKKKLKPLIVAKRLNMGKIFKKLGLSLMMICH